MTCRGAGPATATWPTVSSWRAEEGKVRRRRSGLGSTDVAGGRRRTSCTTCSSARVAAKRARRLSSSARPASSTACALARSLSTRASADSRSAMWTSRLARRAAVASRSWRIWLDRNSAPAPKDRPVEAEGAAGPTPGVLDDAPVGRSCSAATEGGDTGAGEAGLVGCDDDVVVANVRSVAAWSVVVSPVVVLVVGVVVVVLVVAGGTVVLTVVVVARVVVGMVVVADPGTSSCGLPVIVVVVVSAAAGSVPANCSAMAARQNTEATTLIRARGHDGVNSAGFVPVGGRR